MRGKKLLTLGCFAGILAWGACFGPLPPSPHPEPPPPHLMWHDIEQIRVSVTDASEPHAIDSSMLERCIVDSINSQGQPGLPRGVLAGEARRGAAELKVVIEKEEAAPVPRQVFPNFTEWGFYMKMSGTLERDNGAVLWHGRSRPYSGSAVLPNGSTLWSSERFLASARNSICAPLVTQMLKKTHD